MATAIGRSIFHLGGQAVTPVGSLLIRPFRGSVTVGEEHRVPEVPLSVDQVPETAVSNNPVNLTASSEAGELMEEAKETEQVVTQPYQDQTVLSAKSVFVTEKQLHQAIFTNATEKILFSRAIIDLSDSSVAARLDAISALGGIRHELSVKVLSARLRDDGSSRVRQECVKALTSLGMEEGYPAVQRSLSDLEPSVRLAAVWGVYRLGGQRSASVLEGMLSDPDEGVLRRTIGCIGWLGREELAYLLLPLLDDRSMVVRLAAIEAMRNLRSRKVVAGLIECLNDPKESIAKAALRTIETITEKKMGKSRSLPSNVRLRQRLMIRWDQWWKKQNSQ